MSISRNDPCPCGSGYKYKQCCMDAKPAPRWTTMVVGTLFAVVLGAGLVAAVMDYFSADSGDATRQVWSEEHKHWHTVGAGSGTPGPQPPGPVPPGKVWSAEHGHWHDASTAGVPGASAPGPAPPGKVWNTEHGHWHNADGTP